MNIVRFTFCILLAAVILGSGCATRTPDPLAGWHYCFSDNPFRSNKAVIDDYQDYIQKLPPKEKTFVGVTQFFEDGMGQHAVKIEIFVGSASWYHVLIYDKENKRTKVIKYFYGRHMS